MVEFDRRIYLISLAITIIFVLAGYLTMRQIENEKLNEFERIVLNYYLESEKNNLLFLYSKEDFCLNADLILKTQNQKQKKLLEELTLYSKQHLFSDYSFLKNKIQMSNLRLYLYSKKLNNECINNKRAIILFIFDSQEKCSDCYPIRNILKELEKECDKVEIFEFSINTDNEILNLIYLENNIEKAPTIIMPNLKKYTQIVSISDLKQDLISTGFC